jgi:hypothetical protein
MGIVRLDPNGEVEISKRCTEEESARTDAAVITIAEAPGRIAAQRDYDDAVKAKVR